MLFKASTQNDRVIEIMENNVRKDSAASNA